VIRRFDLYNFLRKLRDAGRRQGAGPRFVANNKECVETAGDGLDILSSNSRVVL
jgi:hypothetical protein